MSSNPLTAHIKLPGRVFPLPSKGKFYEPGVLSEHVKNGEVEVKPMSALAEMKIRNADLLFSGKIIRELCVECIPEILKPEKLVTKDVDAIFAYLRLVTYGSAMSVSSVHNCKDAKIHSYEISLESVVSNPNNAVLEHSDMLYEVKLSNGQVLHTKPPTYQDAMELVLMKQDIARLENEGKQPDDEQLKKIFITDLLAVIESVDTPNSEGGFISVSNKTHLAEWLSAISKPVLNEIYEGVRKANVWGIDFNVKLKCKDCGDAYDHSLELDPISFFYG
jgi:hypothetical protein